MNKKERLAFFLGMLSGDGCLPIKHSGEGFRDYAVQFYNTDEQIVELFKELFVGLFGKTGNIYFKDRKNKKRLFNFCIYSKEIVGKIRKLGFPEGVKRDILRVPEIIKEGKSNEKIAFIIGFLITDGCLRKNKSILFHSGSKVFLEELSELTSEIIINKKPIKEFIQREKFRSYQLSLNKKETEILLSEMPTWDNGTPFALSFLKNL
jgi:intein/homing endonuclease